MSQAKFVDPVTGEEVPAGYRSLNKFESRDNQSIQVSADLLDGKIQVQQSFFVVTFITVQYRHARTHARISI